ncbi:MAG TPA: penicillin-binding protein 1C [Vulgatibacter sp.]
MARFAAGDGSTWAWCAAAAGAIVLAAAAFVAWPLPPGLLAREAVSSLRITDREGGNLRELRSREDGRSVPLPAGGIPPLLRAAFLAAEDHRFERHPGVDPIAIAGATRRNLKAGRVVGGASTIPQQLARRLVPRERTFAGKSIEALWALRLSAHLPKERILREYLDRVPLGNSIFGVEAAAQVYFGRPAARLSAAQAALLAGMARSPARLDPFRHEEAARRRMGQVLDRMSDLGWLDPEEARVAAASSLDLVPKAAAFGAPHLVTAVARSLGALGIDGAVRVETTLDPSLQADVEEMVREELRTLAPHRVGQAAVVVIDNPTGEVLAYVGSADFLDDSAQGQNDGVRALRQPGSALKPFVYGLALASGKTPASVLSDVEVHLATPSGDYVPKNYDRRTHGPVRLRAALASSFNVPAVRLADELGPDRALGLLRAAGFESLTEDASHYGVGIVLGNGDVTLLELARAYRGLARGGVAGPLREVRRAWGADGRELSLVPELEESRFLPEPAVALLTDILADESARSPGFGLDNALRLPFQVAAKTGTSRGYVDNWTAGYTAERTVAVWVGNFDGRSMRGVSGITGAGPLFRRVMTRAMRGIHPAPLVDRSRFARADVCPLSGRLAGPACESVVQEVFLQGTEPVDPCPMHAWIPAGSAVDSAHHRPEGRSGRATLAAAGGRGGSAAQPDEDGRRSEGSADGRVIPWLDLGPGFYEWARAEGLAGVRPAVGHSSWSGGIPAAGAGGVRILLPANGDEYLLDPVLPQDAQSIPLRLVVPVGFGELEVRTDDGSVMALAPPYAGSLAPARGERSIEVWARGGAEPLARARFVVR